MERILVVDDNEENLRLMPIPVKSATDSGGSRPPVPEHCGHLFRAFRPPPNRSEATLVFVISQSLCV
jgi:hypothetical protein